MSKRSARLTLAMILLLVGVFSMACQAPATEPPTAQQEPSGAAAVQAQAMPTAAVMDSPTAIPPQPTATLAPTATPVPAESLPQPTATLIPTAAPPPTASPAPPTAAPTTAPTRAPSTGQKPTAAQAVPAPRLQGYQNEIFSWRWDGIKQVEKQDWYFDIQVFQGTAQDPYHVIVAEPQNTRLDQGIWSYRTPVNAQCDSFWVVQVAKRLDGKYAGWLSPRSDRQPIGGSCSGGNSGGGGGGEPAPPTPCPGCG